MNGKHMEGKRGAILISTMIVMILLTAIVVSFLLMQSAGMRQAAADVASHKAFWSAEAGLHKAIWNLKTPVASGGQGKSWVTTGTTESFGEGSYTVKVEAAADACLASNGATATASSQQGGLGPANAIDGNDGTRWESRNVPSTSSPEHITVYFPSPVLLGQAGFVVPPGSTNNRPVDYAWQVSGDGSTFTTVLTVTGNAGINVIDSIGDQTNVSYFRLRVTRIASSTSGVRLGSLTATSGESKITSTGTVGGISRQVVQTVKADDVTQTATLRTDYVENVPVV